MMVPPATLCVFSRVTRSTAATSYGSGRRASATSSAVGCALGASSSTKAMPDSIAAVLTSVPETCDPAGATTRCPGRTKTWSAISLASVPVGT